MIVTWPVIWIGAVIATVLYYVEKTDFARSIPVGNLLRQHFNPQTELPMLHGKVAVVSSCCWHLTVLRNRLFLFHSMHWKK